MSNLELEAKINKEIGKNLKSIRRAVKVSQEELGKSVNVSFQQIQKYENGNNRVSAATLKIFAEKLDVNIQSFFIEDVRATMRPFEERLLRINDSLSRKAQKTLLTVARALESLGEETELGGEAGA